MIAKTENSIDKNAICDIIITQFNIILIKSGGGYGPVKPGNLQNCKVPNPAVKSRKMSEYVLR